MERNFYRDSVLEVFYSKQYQQPLSLVLPSIAPENSSPMTGRSWDFQTPVCQLLHSICGTKTGVISTGTASWRCSTVSNTSSLTPGLPSIAPENDHLQPAGAGIFSRDCQLLHFVCGRETLNEREFVENYTGDKRAKPYLKKITRETFLQCALLRWTRPYHFRC